MYDHITKVIQQSLHHSPCNPASRLKKACRCPRVVFRISSISHTDRNSAHKNKCMFLSFDSSMSQHSIYISGLQTLKEYAIMQQDYIMNHISINNSTVQVHATILLSSALLAVSAQACIPFAPVPLTAQPAALCLIGLMHNTRLAILSVFTYLCAGAIGLPVLAHGSGGFHHFMGPTAGYLFGFILCVYVVSRVKNLSLPHAPLIACVLGSLATIACGTLFLSTIIGWNKAFFFGCAPFIAKAPLNALLATSGYYFLNKTRN